MVIDAAAEAWTPPALRPALPGLAAPGSATPGSAPRRERRRCAAGTYDVLVVPPGPGAPAPTLYVVTFGTQVLLVEASAPRAALVAAGAGVSDLACFARARVGSPEPPRYRLRPACAADLEHVAAGSIEARPVRKRGS